jgi:hypothetical protein
VESASNDEEKGCAQALSQHTVVPIDEPTGAVGATQEVHRFSIDQLKIETRMERKSIEKVINCDLQISIAFEYFCLQKSIQKHVFLFVF